MRLAHPSVMAAAALATFIAGAAATTSAQPRRAAAATAPLLPLSERDIATIHSQGSGCEAHFTIGRRTLAYGLGEQFLVRTAAGRQLCRITDVQIGIGTNDQASVTCAGMRISFRRTGRVNSPLGSDSGDWRASMTIEQGRTRRVLAGTMGSAC